MTRQEFLAWERASRDTIDVKRCYVDLCQGDLVAGILLSQILYWHLPTGNGGDKLVIERDGEKWLAKGRADWWDECRISTKQYDRAAALIQKLGLIETRVMRFGGNPTTHVRVCWEPFLRDLALISMKVVGGKNDIPQRGKTGSPKGEERDVPKAEIGSSPLGENDVPKTSITSTETPPETSAETTSKIATKTTQESEESSVRKIVLSEEDEDKATDAVRRLDDKQHRDAYAASLIQAHERGREDAWDAALQSTIKRAGKSGDLLGSKVAWFQKVFRECLALDRFFLAQRLAAERAQAESPAASPQGGDDAMPQGGETKRREDTRANPSALLEFQPPDHAALTSTADECLDHVLSMVPVRDLDSILEAVHARLHRDPQGRVNIHAPRSDAERADREKWSRGYKRNAASVIKSILAERQAESQKPSAE